MDCDYHEIGDFRYWYQDKPTCVAINGNHAVYQYKTIQNEGTCEYITRFKVSNKDILEENVDFFCELEYYCRERTFQADMFHY